MSTNNGLRKPSIFYVVSPHYAMSVICINPVLGALVPPLRPQIKGAGKVKSLVNKTSSFLCHKRHGKILPFLEIKFKFVYVNRECEGGD